MGTRTTALAVAILFAALAVAVTPVAAAESPTVVEGVDSDDPALALDVEGPIVTPAVAASASPGIAGSAGASSAGATVTGTPAVVEECAANPPEDFSDPEGGTADVVGWVEGYWYDEPLDIDVTDGLTESELERLSARSAARFEAMRCLTVQDGLPPVDIVPREEFADGQSQQFAGVGQTARLVENAKFETMLTIDSETDVVDVRAADTAERVGGFYDFVANEIVIVSDDPDALSIDEEVLVHELGHAIQDQQFDLARYDRATTDRDAGKLGLIEGDVHLIEHEYLDACEAGAWGEACLTDSGATGPPDIANWGLYFEQIQPYSDGPSFVEAIEGDGGWDAVNDLYEAPPTSALHTVYPETYGEVEPHELDVADNSTDEWERIVLENVPTADGPVTHDTLGIGSIVGMFAAPAYEGDTSGGILSEQSTVNVNAAGLVDSFNPHNFAHPETEGWRGDELYTYTNPDNETGTVWELAWASPEDAEPFVEAYDQLVDIRGGERVEEYAYTYSFDNETGYDIAVTMVPDGERVTIVTAPTVEELTAVDQSVELLAAGDVNGNGTDGNGDRTGDGTGDGENGDGTDDPGDGTGGDPGDGTDDDPGDGTGGEPGNGANGDEPDDTGGVGPGLVALPIIGTALLLVLAVLTTGRPRGR